MKRIPTALVITFFCFLASIASADIVVPRQLFPGGLLNVRAPNAEGWEIVSSSEAGMAFAHRGAYTNENYVAQVSLFALPETKNPDEFVALIKRGVENDTPAERFKSLESGYEYTGQRGYPCVRFKGVTVDTKAKTSSFGQESLKLQVYSLYCRHPRHQEVGFSIGFLHRGTLLDAGLGALAEEFIQGVQVPRK
ncbi:MAG: hypothetical protein WC029_14675 [Sulfuricella sp.]|jgi:hypothetical protein